MNLPIAIENGEWGGLGSCASKLCECDKALAKCLRRYYCPKKRTVCTTSPLRLLQNLVMVFWSQSPTRHSNLLQSNLKYQLVLIVFPVI